MDHCNQSENFISIPKGKLLLDRYEVIRLLGEGSSGTVYACRDKILCNWLVAVKIFPPDVVADQMSLERLTREVETLQSIQHQHVSKFYDFFLTDAFIGFAMEHVNGGTLTQKLAVEEKLSAAEIVSVLSQICSGVDAIHRTGIIHRDIKPDNVLINREGTVKIADFGVVRPDWKLLQESKSKSLNQRLNDPNRKKTQDGALVGTIDYLCPEYLAEGLIDLRSDLYAVGLIAYEMITGAIPFAELPLLEFVQQRVEQDPEPIAEELDNCTPRLRKFTMRALERDPANRFQSSQEMLEELRQISTEIQIGPRPEKKVVEKSSLTSLTVVPTKVCTKSLGMFFTLWPVWLIFLIAALLYYELPKHPTLHMSLQNLFRGIF